MHTPAKRPVTEVVLGVAVVPPLLISASTSGLAATGTIGASAANTAFVSASSWCGHGNNTNFSDTEMLLGRYRAQS